MARSRKRKESHWHDGQPSGYDWIGRTTRIAIYLRDNFECLMCGATEEDEGVHLSLDHFNPDGGHHPSNLLTLCLSCNSSRRAMPGREFYAEILDFVHRQLEKPLDRAEALSIAKRRWPKRYKQQAAAQRRLAEKRRKKPEAA
jgi:hypothetical protein